MIPVANPIAEPKSFDAQCRQKGNTWLAANDAGRPPDHWSKFRRALADGFVDRCGFGAMWISSGTVDHFVSCDENRLLTYEWSNFRYIEGWMNSSKQNKRSIDLLDPFEVQEGWFEVDLPSMQLRLTDQIPEEFRARAEYTLAELPLRDDERIVRVRRKWLIEYEQGRASLELIRENAPLIAAAIIRQNWQQSPPAGIPAP